MTSPLSSAEALDESVPGELVASSKGRPWKDVLAQVFIRRPVQESLIIPADPNRIRSVSRFDAGGPCARLHIGLEAPDDLLADLDDGFARLRGAR